MIPNQPIGVDQTLNGSIKRARIAFKKLDSDLGVGIEAGLIPMPRLKSGYLDIQFCVIIDKHEKITYGVGPGFEYPDLVIREVKEKDIEIGDIMGQISRNKNIGKEEGAIGYLSRGLLNRESLTELAVLMAFIPRIRTNLYLEI